MAVDDVGLLALDEDGYLAVGRPVPDCFKEERVFLTGLTGLTGLGDVGGFSKPLSRTLSLALSSFSSPRRHGGAEEFRGGVLVSLIRNS